MGTNFFTNEKENTLLEKIEGVFTYRQVHFFEDITSDQIALRINPKQNIYANIYLFLEKKCIILNVMTL